MSTEAAPQTPKKAFSQQIQQSPESKRRKAIEIDRPYVCQYKKCQKSYGSYPALYTHIKLKHSNAFRKNKESPTKLPAKSLLLIKKVKIEKSPKQVSTNQSTPQIEQQKQQFSKPLKHQTQTDLYENLLETLQQIEQSQETFQAISTDQASEEFPEIQTLNQDFLTPLKSELQQLNSPSKNNGIASKLAELLNSLRAKIKSDLYQELCYFLGFFGKCINIRRIQTIDEAEEDFEQIYQYLHDSIGYCTIFKFKYLKNGKIGESRDELMLLMKKITMDVILITMEKWEEKEKVVTPFTLA